MAPREFLRLLLAARNKNPYALQTSLERPGLQTQLSRFLSGKVKEPRRETLQPVADYFGVPLEAFYDEKIAQVEAERLALLEGLMEPTGGVVGGKTVVEFPPPNQHVANDHQAKYAINNVASIGQTLERLGALLEKADDKTRQDVAALLLRYAQDPAQGKRLAQAIEILLGEPPA